MSQRCPTVSSMEISRFVNDPGLERDYGATLLEDIREAVHESGDCQGCGRVLGSGSPLRIDVQGDERVAVFTVRHATCRPVPDLRGTVLTPSATWRACVCAVPARIGDGTQIMPLVIINPALDVFSVALDDTLGEEWPGLLDPLRGKGFQRPGGALIGSRPRSDLMMSLAVDSRDLTVQLLGGTYSATSSEKLRDIVEAAGGALVVVTYKHHLPEDPAAAFVQTVMADPEGSATIWVPVA